MAAKGPAERPDTCAIVVAIVIALFMNWPKVLDTFATYEADDAAERRAQEIRVALEGRVAEDLRPAMLAHLYGTEGPSAPGGPYDVIGPRADGGVKARVGIRRRQEFRCIRVELPADAPLSVTTKHGWC